MRIKFAEKSRWSITDERRRTNLIFPLTLRKTRRYFYKYQPHHIRVRRYRLSQLPHARVRKYCPVYSFLASYENLCESQYPVATCIVICTEILVHNYYPTVLRKHQWENKNMCILNLEAEISSEWAGLAGWYCRAGCGRSSHFGDEISLSNPALYFIYPDRPSATLDISLLRLTNWLISNQQLPRRALRDVYCCTGWMIDRTKPAALIKKRGFIRENKFSTFSFVAWCASVRF